jgi:hypothetical protein
MEFWFSDTGAPATVVSFGLSVMVAAPWYSIGFQGLGKYLLVECHHRKQAQRRLMMKINAPYRASLSEILGHKKTEPKGSVFIAATDLTRRLPLHQ